MPANPFIDHTTETAPADARPAMERTVRHLGYLPSAVARLAASPELLEGFQQLTALFDASTLEPLAREVVVFTVATRNSCSVCVAMHTARLRAMRADDQLIAALRDGEALRDERLEAVRVFALEVLRTAGAVEQAALDAFLAHGHTDRNALEVVLGIGTYTMSTLANRLTGAPLDGPLREFAWSGQPVA